MQAAALYPVVEYNQASRKSFFILVSNGFSNQFLHCSLAEFSNEFLFRSLLRCGYPLPGIFQSGIHQVGPRKNRNSFFKLKPHIGWGRSAPHFPQISNSPEFSFHFSNLFFYSQSKPFSSIRLFGSTLVPLITIQSNFS